MTDGTRKPIPEGDPVRQNCRIHLLISKSTITSSSNGHPASCLSPETLLEKSAAEKANRVGCIPNKYGFPRYKSNGRDPAIIEWLIESGLIDVEDLRQERRETIKPESKI